MFPSLSLYFCFLGSSYGSSRIHIMKNEEPRKDTVGILSVGFFSPSLSLTWALLCCFCLSHPHCLIPVTLLLLFVTLSSFLILERNLSKMGNRIVRVFFFSFFFWMLLTACLLRYLPLLLPPPSVSNRTFLIYQVLCILDYITHLNVYKVDFLTDNYTDEKMEA